MKSRPCHSKVDSSFHSSEFDAETPRKACKDARSIPISHRINRCCCTGFGTQTLTCTAEPAQSPAELTTRWECQQSTVTAHGAGVRADPSPLHVASMCMPDIHERIIVTTAIPRFVRSSWVFSSLQHVKFVIQGSTKNPTYF